MHRQQSAGRHGDHRRKRPLWMRLLWLGAAILLIASIGILIALHQINRTPRELAPYLAHRADGHRPVIVAAGHWLADYLLAQDRMQALPSELPMLLLGVQENGTPEVKHSVRRQLLVSSIEQLRASLRAAQPGDEITIAPGHYVLNAPALLINQPGTADAPITLRAAQAGVVKIDSMVAESFIVSAPFWVIENLDIRGVCTVQEFCEHAFHVIGNAHHFSARNNRVTDFNAHFKINGAHGQQPDDGEIAYNTVGNTMARRTARAVTPVDLVAASGWRIRKNIVSDFIKTGGDHISYGIFAKGAGSNNHIEQNLILCEHRLRNQPGQRVGLSLGGGATGAAYCRDKQCIVEQEHSVIQANLVMACSDDGIYLNKAADSLVRSNTLIDTGGMTVRFAQSAAQVSQNLVDGVIRSRDDGLVHAQDNQQSSLVGLYLAYHPVRNLFHDVAKFDFDWKQTAAVRSAAQQDAPPQLDLCSNEIGVQAKPTVHDQTVVIGAFRQFSACLVPH